MCTISPAHHEHVISIHSVVPFSRSQTPDDSEEDCNDDRASDTTNDTPDD